VISNYLKYSKINIKFISLESNRLSEIKVLTIEFGRSTFLLLVDDAIDSDATSKIDDNNEGTNEGLESLQLLRSNISTSKFTPTFPPLFDMCCDNRLLLCPEYNIQLFDVNGSVPIAISFMPVPATPFIQREVSPRIQDVKPSKRDKGMSLLKREYDL